MGKKVKTFKKITLDIRVIILICIVIVISYFLVIRIYQRYFVYDPVEWIINTRLKTNKQVHNILRTTSNESFRVLSRAGIILDKDHHVVSDVYDYEDNYTICINQFNDLIDITECEPRYLIDKKTGNLTEKYGCLIDFSNQNNLPSIENVKVDAEEAVRKVLQSSKEGKDVYPPITSITEVRANLKYVPYKIQSKDAPFDPHFRSNDTCDIKDIYLAWELYMSVNNSPGGFGALVDSVTGKVFYANFLGDF